MELLPLDPKIRDWVLIPIFVSSILVSLGRQYASKLLQTNTTSPKVDWETHRSKQILSRSMKLRVNGNVLMEETFEEKKQLFVGKKTGLLRPKNVREGAPPPNPMQDPAAMNNTMKQSFTQMVPQMAMMGFVNYFFTGFVLCKVPFPLTSGFREMLQRGVLLQSLDVSYVSSLSVYFLAMFGLNGFFWLLMSGSDGTSYDDVSNQMGMANPMAQQQQQQQPFDAAKAFESERDSVELSHHSWSIKNWREEFLKI